MFGPLDVSSVKTPQLHCPTLRGVEHTDYGVPYLPLFVACQPTNHRNRIRKERQEESVDRGEW